jgi:hypothetical protein
MRKPRHRLAPEVPPSSPHGVPSLDSCKSSAVQSKTLRSGFIDKLVSPDRAASRRVVLLSRRMVLLHAPRGCPVRPVRSYCACGNSRPASQSMSDRVSERRRPAQLARHYRDQENLTIAEIARRLGRAEATVEAYLYDPTREKARAVKARLRGHLPRLRRLHRAAHRQRARRRRTARPATPAGSSETGLERGRWMRWGVA